MVKGGEPVPSTLGREGRAATSFPCQPPQHAVSIMLLVNDGKLNAAAAISVVVVLVILVVLAIGELLGRAMRGNQQPEKSADQNDERLGSDQMGVRLATKAASLSIRFTQTNKR
jgi:hypothetical protein